MIVISIIAFLLEYGRNFDDVIIFILLRTCKPIRREGPENDRDAGVKPLDLANPRYEDVVAWAEWSIHLPFDISTRSLGAFSHLYIYVRHDQGIRRSSSCLEGIVGLPFPPPKVHMFSGRLATNSTMDNKV